MPNWLRLFSPRSRRPIRRKKPAAGKGRAWLSIEPLEERVLMTAQAVDDFYTVQENAVLSVSAPGVKGNDIADNPNKTVYHGGYGCTTYGDCAGVGPFHGSLTFNADGSFVYVPNKEFDGTDVFRYDYHYDEVLVGLIEPSGTVRIVVEPKEASLPNPNTGEPVVTIAANVPNAEELNHRPGEFTVTRTGGTTALPLTVYYSVETAGEAVANSETD